jgi:hypothetical protein
VQIRETRRESPGAKKGGPHKGRVRNTSQEQKQKLAHAYFAKVEEDKIRGVAWQGIDVDR